MAYKAKDMEYNVSVGYLQCMKSDVLLFCGEHERATSHLSCLCCPQVDKLEEAESQRKTEEEVTEPQPMVFGQQLMLTAAPAPVAPQPAYPGYGYAPATATAATAPTGYPAQPAYGFNM